jgi:hypothetical protein
MPRPKKGTPEGEAANARWRQTMIDKYGPNYKEVMRENGRKGGINGHTGGFASNHALAVKAGAKGGTNSRRGAAIWPQIEKKQGEVLKMYYNGVGVPEIADRFGFTVASVRRFIKQRS